MDPGAQSPCAVRWRSGLFLEDVPAQISAVRLSRLLLLVSPGASNFCPLHGRRQTGLAERSAPARGRRGEWGAGSLPQVSVQAALLVTIRSFSGASRLAASASREPRGNGTSAAHSGALTIPTRRSSRGKRHLPTCWSFAK